MKSKKKSITKHSIIEVEWEDATSSPGWHDSLEGFEEGLLPCKTVGYFLRFTKTSVQLAPTYSPMTRAAADPWSIPTVWIKKIRKLK